MSEPNRRATWAVQSQTPRTRADATGTVSDGYDVSFTTGEGHSGVVFIPMARYTVDKVREVLQAAADQADAVGRLTSES